ncbi:MAG: tRNA uridine-5-carboxymethylaminomethyl(34) synthesis GTPase MnmE [Pseudomonadota bacterium]
MSDTIFALSTARGKAGVAVIRVSGPAAVVTLSALTTSVPPPRQAALRRLTDPQLGEIDEALVLRFEAGHSFTGEDVVEFQTHGGIATIDALLTALGRLPGLRPAEPGEFTRRALENERLDLAQVEALGDLIEAETASQRQQAMRLLSGALGARAEAWRADLLRAVSLIEATIDFADEDVPVDVGPEVAALVQGVADGLGAELAGSAAAERIREGFEVAIVGPPNVGKSTLLNTLAGRDAAITSEIAGTTRDVIEVRMDIAGFAVTLLDTAGLRETEDTVEGIGIARARKRAGAADLRVILLEHEGAAPVVEAEAGDIVVVSKADLHSGVAGAVSARTGAGIDGLLDWIAHELSQRTAGASSATHLRHRLAMEEAQDRLVQAVDQLAYGPETAEIAAHELHLAIRSLDSLVGRIDVEHILGEIFATFCLGK